VPTELQGAWAGGRDRGSHSDGKQESLMLNTPTRVFILVVAPYIRLTQRVHLANMDVTNPRNARPSQPSPSRVVSASGLQTYRRLCHSSLPSRLRETLQTAGPPRSTGGWDRSRARLAAGWWFPFPLFRCRMGSQPHHGARFPMPPMMPPMMPEGRISGVRFETSACLP
jgi:hypothetical protein